MDTLATKPALEQLRWEIQYFPYFLFPEKDMEIMQLLSVCLTSPSCLTISPQMQFARHSEHKLPELYPFIWCPWLQQHHNEFVQYQYAQA